MEITNFFKNRFIQFTCALAFCATLMACGDDSSSSASEEESSSSVPSFKSSSSLSTRADIDYKDTVAIGDTMNIYLELFKGDSSKMDASELYLDSAATTFPLFLGKIPKGSKIKVYASTSEIFEDKLRIRDEYGQYLKALIAVSKSALSKDSAYGNFLVPSLGTDSSATFKDSNQFVTFQENYYYLEAEGEFNDKSSLRLKVLIDSSYYGYTGDEDSSSMKMSDTLRGIISIDEAPENISIQFSAKDGYWVNLKTVGRNITQYRLMNGETKLGQSETNIDTMLVPNDSVLWSIQITPEQFSSIWTGPYAFFEVVTQARKLEQGEFFSEPDSILYPGEAFMRIRPIDDHGEYKYNLRQEQFVWIGDYKVGDSLILQHWIKNYTDDAFTSPVTYEILDQNEEVQGSISSVYGGSFVVKKGMPEGPYYLHYLRLNSYPLDQGLEHDSLRYRLQLYTMVQQPGLLKTLQLYNSETGEVNNNPVSFTVGDTIDFTKFEFYMEQSKNSSWDIIGSDISWFVPCASLNFIDNSSDYKSKPCNEEQEISTNYLIAQETGVGETAELIAQSVADPSMRDTIDIIILGKSN